MDTVCLSLLNSESQESNLESHKYFEFQEEKRNMALNINNINNTFLIPQSRHTKFADILNDIVFLFFNPQSLSDYHHITRILWRQYLKFHKMLGKKSQTVVPQKLCYEINTTFITTTATSQIKKDKMYWMTDHSLILPADWVRRGMRVKRCISLSSQDC